MSALRIGLVGAGRWAALHHLPGLAADPRAALTAVFDPDTVRRDEVVRRFGGIACSNLAELLEGVDAVVVASPPAAHHDAVAAALDRAMPVLVEKPMTITAADAWDLVERADRAGVPLMVGYTFEVAPTADRVVEAVGQLGELVLVDGVYASSMRHLFDGSAPARDDDPLAVPHRETFADPAISGGGQARGQLTHLLAAAIRAAALPASAVSALFRPDHAPIELHVALSVDLGAAVATFASTCALPPGHPPMWELRYVGERGSVVHDLATGTATIRTADHDERTIGPLPADERYPSRDVVRRFIDVVLDGAPNPTPGRLGAEVAAILEAAHASAARGGTPHAVPRPEASA